MKSTTYMVCIFALLLLFCIVILQFHSPLSDFGQADCVWWLEWDRDIHRSFLLLPEDPYGTGTYASHILWIERFDQIIYRILKIPSKLTKDECIQLLYLAQSTHAGSEAVDYSTVNWNARWFEAYTKIIAYMKAQ